ncbi:predicted protein [Sclerotinia sclerotiorum 1980 UF-70]|uniref:Uncharacterized protein n=1 Tax=Sclerotinia sclerotiorum (strain ATCC 18683 / 1980 / Ss-1) TaxID=665079 RepID=A7EM11_SCLS1|nr:predicted protein [Sclerotinia sclerotiorum 1980 UF-70]EDO03877.1 predicted protein [Sclerotinia sclerotiorum 1980 UF-70]
MYEEEGWSLCVDEIEKPMFEVIEVTGVIDLKLEQSHRLNMLKVMNVHFKFHEVFPNTQGSAMQDPSSNSHKPSCLDTRDWGAVILSLARHRRQVTRPTAVASNISTP